MRFFLFLSVCVLLSGCNKVRLAVFQTDAQIAYDSAQVREVATWGQHFHHVRGQPIDPNGFEFFRENSFGRHWLKQNNNKVITIGHPKECATYNSRWGHSSLFQAVAMTMQTCLKRVEEFSRHTGKKCGCRVAAINDTVLFSPEELPFRKHLPAIALVKDTSGRKEILGYAVTTGRTGQNQPFDFYTQSDQKVCSGTYNLGAVSYKGEAQLNCFGGRIQGPAVFKVAGFREGQAYGTALVKAGENELVLVYGLPSHEFEKRRAGLLQE